MIYVVAAITAHPGQREALLAIFNEYVPTIRAENGCVDYVAATDAEGFGAFATPLGPDSFFVIERWADAAALKAHARAPHMAAYMGRSSELIASRAIHVLSAVS